MKDINGIEIRIGDTVKAQQHGGGVLPQGSPSVGVVEGGLDAFGNDALFIRVVGPRREKLILINHTINEVI